VHPLTIVKDLNVIKDLITRLLPRLKPVSEFGLQDAEESLGDRVIQQLPRRDILCVQFQAANFARNE
jgi:hypothetical protein